MSLISIEDSFSFYIIIHGTIAQWLAIDASNTNYHRQISRIESLQAVYSVYERCW